MAKARKHFDFDEIEEYLRNKTYASTIPARDFGSKSNIRGATKSYEVKDGHKTKNAKWKLSETCTEVLEILNTPRQ